MERNNNFENVSNRERHEIGPLARKLAFMYPNALRRVNENQSNNLILRKNSNSI